MDFFRSQQDAQRRTIGFLLLFVVVVLLVAFISSYVVVRLFFFETTQISDVAILTVVILCIIATGCLIRVVILHREGGAAVAHSLGGELLPEAGNSGEDDRLHIQRFRNIVEEMSIASGTPAPALYWLPNESSINAFVAGLSPSDAVLAVTRGALECLDRNELQAVVAHEFGHLLNGDMRLNTRVACWLFGIFSIYIIGRSIFRIRARASSGDSAKAFLLILITGLALMAIGYLGKIGGRLLQAAISRQREYLADASAVQFTRQKDGLAGALKKIYFLSSELQTVNADNYNHLFLNDGVKISRLFSSHPPLLERIRRLDPSFHPEIESMKLSQAQNGDFTERMDHAITTQFAAENLAQNDTTSSMRDELAWLFAVLIDNSDKEIQEKQLRRVEADWGEYGVTALVRKLAGVASAQPVYRRLTRLRVRLARLRYLSAQQKTQLEKTLFALVTANEEISLLEAAVAYMVRRYLDDIEHPAQAEVAGHLSYEQCRQSVALLKVLVSGNPRTAPEYLTLVTLAGDSGQEEPLRARAMENALDQLNRLSFEGRRRLFQELVQSCGDAVSEDQWEIIALIAVCLHASPLLEESDE
ncbi:MAG: M48 family metallopeptidase [Burkholderiales bacterium]|jgi:Zn-dependent protease with chaperone function|nr:M48 family metallopeptidase [Burkholderiales bacterium]